MSILDAEITSQINMAASAGIIEIIEMELNRAENHGKNHANFTTTARFLLAICCPVVCTDPKGPHTLGRPADVQILQKTPLKSSRSCVHHAVFFFTVIQLIELCCFLRHQILMDTAQRSKPGKGGVCVYGYIYSSGGYGACNH